MKKSKIKKIIKEEFSKMLNESFEVLNKWPLDIVSYEDVVRVTEEELKLPSSFTSDRLIRDEDDFNSWKNEIHEKYGTEGFLAYGKEGLRYKINNFKIIGNFKWDAAAKLGADAVTSFNKDVKYFGD